MKGFVLTAIWNGTTVLFHSVKWLQTCRLLGLGLLWEAQYRNIETMATPSKKGKYLYEANDLVDEFLFNEVANHVNPDFISRFGLKFYSDLPYDQFAREGQTEGVSKILTIFLVKYISCFNLLLESDLFWRKPFITLKILWRIKANKLYAKCCHENFCSSLGFPYFKKQII